MADAPKCRRDRRPRKWLVWSLLALLVGGQAVAVVRSQEYWPFSPYPMYAELQEDRDFSTIRLVGVSNDNREMSLDAAWLRKSLTKIARREDAPFALKNAMASYVKKYGWRRPGDPRGSPNRLRAIRVYEQKWSLQQDASNATTRPDENHLLAEIRRAPDGGIDGL